MFCKKKNPYLVLEIHLTMFDTLCGGLGQHKHKFISAINHTRKESIQRTFIIHKVGYQHHNNPLFLPLRLLKLSESQTYSEKSEF